MHPVLVNLAFDIVAGMKIEGHMLCLFNDDTVGQQSIKGFEEDKLGEMGRNPEIRNLMKRMNTGIRSPGSNKRDRFACYGGDLLFDSSLNSRFVLLTLPSEVAGSIIGNDELYVFLLIIVFHNELPEMGEAFVSFKQKREGKNLPSLKDPGGLCPLPL